MGLPSFVLVFTLLFIFGNVEQKPTYLDVGHTAATPSQKHEFRPHESNASTTSSNYTMSMHYLNSSTAYTNTSTRHFSISDSSNITQNRYKRQTNNLRNVYSVYTWSQVFVPKSTHIFVKPVNFAENFREIVILRLSLHEIGPDLSHTLFVPFESNGNRFFKSTALKTGTQNSLVCANIGEQITLTSYIHNRINSDTPVSLIGNISVHRTGMTCTLQDHQYEDISCLRQ
jgi:hypothetical protein